MRIPGKDCLNVAVAGSIVLYDRLRQWKENGKKIDLPDWGIELKPQLPKGGEGRMIDYHKDSVPD